MISVSKYNDYQSSNNNINNEVTDKTTTYQQRINNEVTTNKNDKNDKNDKKIINSPQNSFPSSSKTKTELIPDYNKVNDIEISDELMKKYFPN